MRRGLGGRDDGDDGITGWVHAGEGAQAEMGVRVRVGVRVGVGVGYEVWRSGRGKNVPSNCHLTLRISSGLALWQIGWGS